MVCVRGLGELGLKAVRSTLIGGTYFTARPEIEELTSPCRRERARRQAEMSKKGPSQWRNEGVICPFWTGRPVPLVLSYP